MLECWSFVRLGLVYGKNRQLSHVFTATPSPLPNCKDMYTHAKGMLLVLLGGHYRLLNANPFSERDHAKINPLQYRCLQCCGIWPLGVIIGGEKVTSLFRGIYKPLELPRYLGIDGGLQTAVWTSVCLYVGLMHIHIFAGKWAYNIKYLSICGTREPCCVILPMGMNYKIRCTQEYACKH